MRTLREFFFYPYVVRPVVAVKVRQYLGTLVEVAQYLALVENAGAMDDAVQKVGR